MAVRRLGTWLLLTCSVVGCENAPTQIIVRFEAEPVSAARARSLHVRVLSQEGDVRLDRTVAIGDGPGQVRFPTRVPIVPIGGDASRVFRVEAELRDSTDAPFSEQRALLGFVRDELFEVTILFDDACIGQLDCPDETTCRDSVCVDARIPVGEPGPAGRSERQIGECTTVCWENPRPTPNYLNAVCVDPVLDLAIAVGAGGRAYERIDGIWNSTTTGTGLPGHDIACLGEGTAVVVGHMGTVAFRDASGAWSTESSGTTAELYAVAGDTNEVWAAGAGGLVLRRRGGVWEPIASGTSIALVEVAYASPEEVWVSGGDRTLLRFDGVGFAPVEGPTAIATDSYDQMTFSTEGLLLRVENLDTRPIYRRLADGTWAFEFSAGLGVTDLSGHPSGWVAGPGGRGDLYVRTPASEWETVGYTGGDNLTGAAAGDGVAYYVGPQGEIARWSRDGGMTFEVERATEALLTDVSAHPSDPVFAVAVGVAGTLVERARVGVWRLRTISDGEVAVRTDLFGAHVTDTGAYAVGGGGVIAERDGSGQWVRVASPVSVTLESVHASAERTIAVGAAGTVVERIDGVWRALPSAPTPDDLTAVHVRGAIAFAGTSTGEILRLDGTTWTSIGRGMVEPGRVDPLVVKAIRGDATSVFAAIGRSLYRVDDSGLTMLPAPTADGDADDVGVWMGRPRYAVTRALWIDDGTGWVTTNAEADAIAVTSEGVGLIVGPNGWIARTR